MIDTIKLTLHEGQFRIMKHERFSPSTQPIYEPPYLRVTGAVPFKAVNNPTNADKSQHGYLPRLTFYKAVRAGGYTTLLQVEFSIPKLLHGNNFDEVDEQDFTEVYQKLHRKLYLMGVSVPNVQDLIDADVSAVHYGKNVVLTDYTSATSIIREIAKANINKQKDVNQTDFRNGGYSFKYHTNSHEVIFYDKLMDLKQAHKSEKRAIEKDNYVQLSLFDQVEPQKPFEVLRMEVRLGGRKQIKKTLEQHGVLPESLTFRALFSKRIAQVLLSSELMYVEESRVVDEDTQPLAKLLANTLAEQPNLGYRSLLAVVGAKALIAEMGVRQFRDAMAKYSDSNWYRLKRDLDNPMASNTDLLLAVKQQLNKFETVLLAQYQEQL